MENQFIDTLAIFSANYLYLLLLFVALVWFLVQPRSSQLDMAAWGSIALPVMALLLLIAGLAYNDPRPFVVGHYTPLIPHGPDSGFPSDHTLLCSATATIVYFFDRKMSLVLWILTGIVGASRVYTGVHHPLDIVASVIIAFSVGYLVWRLALPAMRSSRLYTAVAGIFGQQVIDA